MLTPARSFVCFVNFVVSLGADLGAPGRLASTGRFP